MKQKYFFTSMTRISDLSERAFEVNPLAREHWATGDYVVGKIELAPAKSCLVEITTGRMVEVLDGDLVVGALGVRRATLEVVGDWQHIEADGYMQALTEGGLFGRATSVSFLVKNLPPMRYQGHVMRQGAKVCMKDFVPARKVSTYNCPTIMMLGTSMSSGKTTTSKAIVRELKKAGLKVVGAKLAGAGQYHDIQAMEDAGAEQIFDFVDVGLPSSVLPPDDYRQCLRQLLTLIAAEEPDIVVAEVGASPFEPYNGEIALQEMKQQICFTVLCASDPYAVVGAIRDFGLNPDIISGIVADTTAGVALVEGLTGVKTITLSNQESQQQLSQLLKDKITPFKNRSVLNYVSFQNREI
jgi:hypothetical protein